MGNSDSMEASVDYILRSTEHVDDEHRLSAALELVQEYARDRGSEAVQELRVAVVRALISPSTKRHERRGQLALSQHDDVDQRRLQVDRVVEGVYENIFNPDALARSKREVHSIPVDADGSDGSDIK